MESRSGSPATSLYELVVDSLLLNLCLLCALVLSLQQSLNFYSMPACGLEELIDVYSDRALALQPSVESLTVMMTTVLTMQTVNLWLPEDKVIRSFGTET